MLKSTKKVFYLILLIFVGCDNSSQIRDIIQPIKLVAGETDTIVISDLFYALEYNLDFSDNEKLDINRIEDKLYITADPSFEGMTLLEFEADMNVYQIPVISQKQKYYKFSFKPDKIYEQLNLFGSFNGWNRTNLKMTDNDKNRIFEASVSLEPGVYQYKFFGDGEEIVDPVNPLKVSNGMGSFNSIRTIEDSNTNKFYLHVDEYYSKSPQSTFSFYVEDELEGELTIKNVFALLDNVKVSQDKINLDGKYISISFNYNELENQTLRIALSKNGRVSNFQTIKLFDGQPASNETFTWEDGIIYSLMIDRFHDGDNNNSSVQHDSLSDKANYMGGDLQGVLQKLNEGYFDSLGVNTIWISPVYDNPNEAYREYPAPHRFYSGYHGYWPISTKTVDDHFGKLEDVKEFVNTAHKHGIKILLDFVSNHVHTEHPYFKEHRDWFGQLELPDGRLNLRFWDEFRLTTWFEPYLASFDYLGSEEALEEMTDVAVWWLNETGADGYRHDAVKHVPNKFWRRLNEKIKKEVSSKRDLPVYQIGETFGSYELISSYVNNGQLNSQFNFNLYDVALPSFIRDDLSFSGLNKEMQKTFSVYGVNHQMGNVMDSHDKNRFMAFADGDLDASEWSAIEKGWNNPPTVDNSENYKKLILYMAYMNTIPGLPVIYYGSEFGMSGASDPDNRRMMRFGSNLTDHEKNTLSEVSSIINLRKEHSALRHGDYYTLMADENIYAYVRSDMNERILIIINKSQTEQNLELVFPSLLTLNSAKNLSENKSILIDNNKLKTGISGMNWAMYLLK
jgi:cyclomaltodextrinase / maltogenic alpha-amylase / neopullulanase